jgi:kexin
LVVKDTIVNENNGTFIDWHLKLWGESIDASKATLLPMPTEEDDDNHDQVISSTTSIAGTTTSVDASVPTSSIPANPTDHPDRPTKPTATGTTDEETTPTGTSAPSATTSSWLPSFFGVGPKTQIWIYGAAALILIFCCGLGVYLYMARRKRLLNNPRDEWEFDLLEEDEADGLNGGGKLNRKGGKRRAGELYDAFAAGSEDESDDGGDEREKKLYEDEESDDEGNGSGQHVIGDDEESDVEGGSEKRQGESLLHK